MYIATLYLINHNLLNNFILPTPAPTPAPVQVEVPVYSKIENCYQQEKDVCIQCNSGYEKIINSCLLCNKSEPNCENYLETGNYCDPVTNKRYCKTCKNNYQLSADKLNCQAYAPISNCETQENDLCHICKTGFLLLENECIGCSETVTNCQTYINTGSYCDKVMKKRYCEVCKPDYLLSYNKLSCEICDKSVTNCKTYFER
eukprot:Pgem_evm1s9092